MTDAITKVETWWLQYPAGQIAHDPIIKVGERLTVVSGPSAGILKVVRSNFYLVVIDHGPKLEHFAADVFDLGRHASFSIKLGPDEEARFNPNVRILEVREITNSGFYADAVY